MAPRFVVRHQGDETINILRLIITDVYKNCNNQLSNSQQYEMKQCKCEEWITLLRKLMLISSKLII